MVDTILWYVLWGSIGTALYIAGRGMGYDVGYDAGQRDAQKIAAWRENNTTPPKTAS